MYFYKAQRNKWKLVNIEYLRLCCNSRRNLFVFVVVGFKISNLPNFTVEVNIGDLLWRHSDWFWLFESEFLSRKFVVVLEFDSRTASMQKCLFFSNQFASNTLWWSCFHSIHKFDTFELKAIKNNDIRKKRGLPSATTIACLCKR